ncbi:MAG: hypothetical protein FH749_00945 [Firmicutes bacterium]|nr:hypothetical protein [Bacillota bacterium]
MPKVVLSHKQFVFMLYVYLIGASMLFVPEAIFAGKDAWISVLIAPLISMLLLAIWLHLQRKHPGMSLIQYGIKILGPWIGYPIGLYLVYVMFLINLLIIEDLVIVTSIVILPQTPSDVIRLTFVFVAIYGCYKGVESIARMCELAFIPLTLLVVALPILEYQELGLAALQPFSIINWHGVVVGTINSLVFPFAEVFIPAMLLPFVSIDTRSERYYFFAIGGAGIALLLRTLVALMVLGPELLSMFTLPIMTVFRVVDLGDFFNRVEGLFLGIWYVGLLLKFVITLYAMTLGLAQLTGVKRLENLWLSVGALVLIVSALRFPNEQEFGFMSFFILPFIAVPVEIIYPLALLLVDWLQERLKPVSVDHLNQRHD